MDRGDHERHGESDARGVNSGTDNLRPGRLCERHRVIQGAVVADDSWRIGKGARERGKCGLDAISLVARADDNHRVWRAGYLAAIQLEWKR